MTGNSNRGQNEPRIDNSSGRPPEEEKKTKPESLKAGIAFFFVSWVFFALIKFVFPQYMPITALRLIVEAYIWIGLPFVVLLSIFEFKARKAGEY